MGNPMTQCEAGLAAAPSPRRRSVIQHPALRHASLVLQRPRRNQPLRGLAGFAFKHEVATLLGKLLAVVHHIQTHLCQFLLATAFNFLSIQRGFACACVKVLIIGQRAVGLLQKPQAKCLWASRADGLDHAVLLGLNGTDGQAFFSEFMRDFAAHGPWQAVRPVFGAVEPHGFVVRVEHHTFAG